MCLVLLEKEISGFYSVTKPGCLFVCLFVYFGRRISEVGERLLAFREELTAEVTLELHCGFSRQRR